jgi:hypothetical protein
MFRHALFLLAFICAHPAHAIFDFLEPANLSETFKKQIAKQKIQKEVGVDGEIFKGVTAAVKYKYLTEPSYIDKYYIHYDKYTVQAGINPAAWLEDLQLPFALGFGAGSEIVFARQFKSQFDKDKIVPYTPLNLPGSAERALEKLMPGDFVSFQTNMSLAVSVGFFSPTSALVSSGATHVVVQGTFLVHFFKIDDKHVRLKFIALRGEDTGVNVAVNSAVRKFEVTGINYLDKRITNRFKIDPLAIGVDVNKNDLFMVDYVMDLSKPEVAKAYDEIMQKKMRFKTSEMLNPITDRKVLENTFVTDLSNVEALFAEDKEKKEEDRRINRLFKGSDTSEGSSGNIKFGLNIIRYESNSYYANNRILSVDKNENPNYFVFDTFSIREKTDRFFKFFTNEENINTNLLFAADENYQPTKFAALVLSREKKISGLTMSGLKDIRDIVRRALPDTIYKDINWKTWDYGFAEKVNVGFKHQITFSEDCLKEIPDLGEAGFYARLETLVDGMDLRVQATNNDHDVERDQSRYNSVRYKEDLSLIAKALGKAFTHDAGVKNSIRHENFVTLKDNELFRQIGARFLLELLPQDRLKDLVHYEMTLTGKGSEQIKFPWGKEENSDLYKSLLYIQSVMNDRSIDMRLYKEEGDTKTNQITK